jgi:hypothetical protein
MSPRAAAWLAWSLCALTPLSISCAVALAILNSTDVFSLFYLVAVALCALVGGVVAIRRSANPVGWILLSVGAILAFQEFALQYATFGLLTDPGSLPLARVMAWLKSWLYAPGIVLLLSFLPLYFPDGQLISVRWRWIVRFALFFSVTVAVFFALSPGEIQNEGIVNPLGIEALRPIGDLLSTLFLAQYFTLLFASAASLVVRYKLVQGEERQQIKWLAYAAAALPAWFLINPLFEAFIHPELFHVMESTISALLFAGIPVAVGIAILKYRLYDIDIIINRTLVYGSLTVLLVLLYFGGIVMLQRVFVIVTGEKSTLAVVASTLVIAALFTPLRRRVQALVDRRFYRRKYDARKTLEAFSAKLRDETDLQTLNNDLVGVVSETMQPVHVSLWLRPSNGFGKRRKEEHSK